MQHPPKVVCALCYGHDAWIVGSACIQAEPRDWDVIVPFSEWAGAAFLIPPDAKPNTFGGFKCISEGAEVDVWPGDLGKLFINNAQRHAWHLKSGVRINKV